MKEIHKYSSVIIGTLLVIFLFVLFNAFTEIKIEETRIIFESNKTPEECNFTDIPTIQSTVNMDRECKAFNNLRETQAYLLTKFILLLLILFSLFMFINLIYSSFKKFSENIKNKKRNNLSKYTLNFIIILINFSFLIIISAYATTSGLYEFEGIEFYYLCNMYFILYFFIGTIVVLSIILPDLHEKNIF
ncbi:MAG: hypothetical protein WC356_06935 [Candidatus Micrarchaeia archaeon]|jgi:hypothetical protein